MAKVSGTVAAVCISALLTVQAAPLLAQQAQTTPQAPPPTSPLLGFDLPQVLGDLLRGGNNRGGGVNLPIPGNLPFPLPGGNTNNNNNNNNRGNWQGQEIPPPGNQGPGNQGSGWNNDNWSGQIIRCESPGDYRECGVDTSGGVRLVERLSRSACTSGESWGWTQGRVWVDRGCAAQFQARGSVITGQSTGQGWQDGPGQQQQQQRRGTSPFLIIGGVAVAAGLVAWLLSKRGKKDAAPAAQTADQNAPVLVSTPPVQSRQAEAAPAEVTTALPGGPRKARSVWSSTMVGTAAQPALASCMTDIGRQIGATGGTEVRLIDVLELTKSPDSYRFRLELAGAYPDGSRTIPVSCSADAKVVRAISFG